MSNLEDAETVDFSVILPTFNEEGNASRLVSAIVLQFQEEQCRYEILVMDDESDDNTIAEIREAHGDNPQVMTHVRKNRPKGLALSISDGIYLSKGENVIVMDSDFNHDPTVLPEMIKLSKYYDLISGSRFTPGGGMESRWRYWCSFIFNLWVRVILLMPTRDNLAGFYCVKRSCLMKFDLEKIFLNYGDYYFRFLYTALALDIRLIEIPVYYKDREHGQSKTKFLSMLLLYTKEAIMTRFIFSGAKEKKP